MTINDLATKLNLHKSGVHRKIKRMGIVVQKMARHTDGGVQMVSIISSKDASKILSFYKDAK